MHNVVACKHTHTHTHTHTHICMHTHACTLMHARTHACTHTHTHVHSYIHVLNQPQSNVLPTSVSEVNSSVVMTLPSSEYLKWYEPTAAATTEEQEQGMSQ